MSISKWDFMAPYPRLSSIDRTSPTVNTYNSFEVGILYLGGVKALLRRALHAFDLNSAPAVGVPLTGSEVISDAYIEARNGAPIGATNQPAYISRVTRYDWVKTECTWNVYRTANNWTQTGGDVDIVTPTRVNWSTPTASGPITIPGLVNFATDALANRGGIVNMLAQLVGEADDGIERYTGLADVFFCLDYQDGDAPVPRQVESSQGKVLVRPDFDHLADQRASEVGEFLRDVRGAERMIERSLR